MNRQTLMLVVVGVLLAVRFVVVPLDDHRLEVREEFDQKQTRLDKGMRLLEQAERFSETSTQIDTQLGQLESQFPSAPSRVEAQLVSQQQIQALARERNVNLSEMAWLETSDGNPERALLKIDFEGDLKDFVYFFTEVINIGPWIRTKDIQYRVTNQRIRYRRLGSAKGSVTLEVYYLVQEQTA